MARPRLLGSVLLLGALLTVLSVGAAPSGGHAPEHAEGDHGLAPFNWAQGFLGVSDDVAPGLLYRRSGTPMPFLANVINAGLLFGLIYVAGRKPIALALRERKERIVLGMEEAGRMKAEAAATLARYEEKLRLLDEEIERIRREMRESAEAERQRIFLETKERRERMERDARLLVEQEIKAAREALTREAVAGAVRSAEEILAKQIGAADHDRIAREYLEGMAGLSLNSMGGRS